MVDALQAASRDAERPVRYAAIWALGHVSLDPSGLEVADEPNPPVYDEKARPVRLTRPVYPRQAFDDGVQGTVVIDILIGEEGEVAHARVRQSIPGLDGAALECVKAWKFTPAVRAGRPAASVGVAPVRFQIY